MKRLLQDLKTLDRQAVVVLTTAAVVLVGIQFRGKVAFWRDVAWMKERFPLPLDLDFATQAAWATSTCIGFGVIPFLVAVFGLGMRPSEFGFRWKGFLRHLPIYLGMIAFMAPLLWWAAQRPDFRETYPFPRLARNEPGGILEWEYFWIWQAFYFLQFCALEMFFRGFMIFGLEKRFGLNAIFVMAIPYAMIHFSKPMPEAFGAIIAGIVLGYMALRTRSFYGGILLHYAIGLSMDLLSRRP